MSKRKAAALEKEEADGAAAPYSMAGKVILITGGGQGLGFAVAKMAAQRKAKGLVIVDCNAAHRARVEEER